MQKAIIRNCMNPIRLVVLGSFIFCVFLLLFDYTALKHTRNKVTLVVDDYINASSPSPPTPTTSFISIDENPEEAIDKEIPTMRNSSSSSPPPPRRPSKRTRTKKKKRKTEAFKAAYEYEQPKMSKPESCTGRYIYVHDLPRRYNEELVKNCGLPHLKWSEVCRFVWENMGLGPKVQSPKRVLTNKGWYFTSQFSMEVIFHHRMKQYDCLTRNSSLAAAIYVPFYAGLDVGPYLWGFNMSVRDKNSLDLVKWISGRDEWKRMWGRDHFLVTGRITWDFRRHDENDSDWGTKLMFLPEAKNMSMLTIEAGFWNNDIAIPYPTYFHPSSDKQIIEWQKNVNRQKRPYLFCFVGAPRPKQEDSIRGELINQCKSTRNCNFLACLPGQKKCGDPVSVMRTFQSSVFCLQPPGDSLTRRSVFDSILAGCIPVFFHPGTAYSQYLWHLPSNYRKYSVFISSKEVKAGKVNISETLLRVPTSEVLAMRNQVVRIIPNVIYADPRSKLESIEDAFDIAVKGIIERVESIRKGIREGKDPSVGFADLNLTRLEIPGLA